MGLIASRDYQQRLSRLRGKSGRFSPAVAEKSHRKGATQIFLHRCTQRGRAMKKALLGTVAILVLALASASQAPAADLRPLYKAPPPAPASNWAGFYAGVNAGGGMANADFLD